MKRLLLINPNTTEAMTQKVLVAARAALPGVEIIAITGRFGAQYIASRASFAIAAHAALEAYAAHGGGCDAVLLACFGDPGLDALREVSPVPVIGLVEAACVRASFGQASLDEASLDEASSVEKNLAATTSHSRRFSIVTGGERWSAMLAEMVLLRGFQLQLASIRTVAPSGGAISADPAAAHGLLARSCMDCVEQDGAEAVILGGAGLIGLAAVIQPMVTKPVICSMEAGFAASRAALAQAVPDAPLTGTDKVTSTGLSPALSELLRLGRLI